MLRGRYFAQRITGWWARSLFGALQYCVVAQRAGPTDIFSCKIELRDAPDEFRLFSHKFELVVKAYRELFVQNFAKGFCNLFVTVAEIVTLFFSKDENS